MPTSIGHAFAGYALGAVAAPLATSRRFRIACTVAAVIPDLDVLLAVLPGSVYTSLGGHRGITHSLSFAAVAATVVVMVGFRHGGPSPGRAWAGLAAAFVSHPLLDMLTSYGNGVALFAPFTWTFVRFPWHPIDPDTASRAATTGWGQLALGVGNEVLWVWVPALAMLAAARAFRSGSQPPQGASAA
jgi:inner membrane protein